jgi:hypothetical protein
MADLKELEARLQKKREANQARRVAEAERLKEAALVEAIEVEDWDEAAAKLIAANVGLGVQGVDWQIARLKSCAAVFKKPARVTWEKYTDARRGEGATCADHLDYIRGCLVTPTQPELSSMLDQLPAFLATCTGTCIQLGQGGARTWEGK